MINAILIDDETSSTESMQWLINTYCPDVRVQAICHSAMDGMTSIRQHHPDVVFLDIEMPKMNGFEMLELLGKVDFDVVFTTAYDQFALRAFRYAALNYLLKPVEPDDLVATIERLKEKKSIATSDQLQIMFQGLLNKEKAIDRIALSTSDGLVFVHTKDIAYCKAESNYTNVVLESGRKILVAKTLKEINETLSGKDFFRVHNTYLVNLNHIVRFVRGDGGYIIMPDKTEITISRTRRDEFFQLFARF